MPSNRTSFPHQIWSSQRAHWVRRVRAHRRVADSIGPQTTALPATALAKWWFEHGIEFDSCVYCGGYTYRLSALVPYTRDGRFEKGNLIPTCDSCDERSAGWTLDRKLSTLERLGFPVYNDGIGRQPLLTQPKTLAEWDQWHRTRGVRSY